MSHSDATFHDDLSIDPFLMGFDGDHQMFTNEQLDRSFTKHEAGLSSASADSDREVREDLHFELEDSLIPTGNSSNATTVSSTSDYSGYTFGRRQPSAYPTPGSNSPRPHPLQLQQSYNQHHQHPSTQQRELRPLTTRSQTNTSTLRSQKYSRAQQPSHRRSLSQGDADRIAAATRQNHNPVFFRLQAPRSRSAIPNDDSGRLKRRTEPYAKCRTGMTASQGLEYAHANLHSRVGIPTSTSVDATTIHRIMLLTNIGTPMEADDGRADVNRLSIQLNATGKTDPYFARMSHSDQENNSRKVIEVGAMAVINQPIPYQIPQFDGDDKGSRREKIMKKLEEVEKHLKQEMGDRDESLKGCEMIREAFAKKDTTHNACKEEATERYVDLHLTHPWPSGLPYPQSVCDEPVASETIFPPSTAFSKEHEFYNTDDSDLFAMIKTETQR